MSSKLLQLRATLEQLEEYELPEKYQGGSSSGDNVQPVLADEALIRRYNDARNAYLQKQMQRAFYDHVGTWDGTSFEMPPVPTEEEQQETQAKSEEVQMKLSETAAEVSRKMQLLQNKYMAFSTQRDELRQMIREMEQAEEAREGELSQDDDGDSLSQDVDEEDMALEEQRLANLTQRRAELEAQLRSIRSETAQAKVSMEESQLAVNQMMEARGATPSDDAGPRAVSPETITGTDLSTVEQVEAETAELRKRVSQLREMSVWYESICESVEEIGGIKILSVEDGPTNNNDVNKDDMIMHFQLLGKHEVEVGLKLTRGAAKRKHASQKGELRVSRATFMTETLVTDNQNDEGTVVQMRIPPLDDLVRIGASLGKVEDLQFLLRETMARIRTITARVEELANLRTRYLTKIGKSCHFDYGFGGKDQEIVCSLNEGVTVVLRLSPDCPMVDGSVYVEQIVGVGGWDQAVLDRVRDLVNATTCRGPLALMDSLMMEIQRLETEEGVVVPRTPSMPARKGA